MLCAKCYVPKVTNLHLQTAVFSLCRISTTRHVTLCSHRESHYNPRLRWKKLIEKLLWHRTLLRRWINVNWRWFNVAATSQQRRVPSGSSLSNVVTSQIPITYYFIGDLQLATNKEPASSYWCIIKCEPTSTCPADKRSASNKAALSARRLHCRHIGCSAGTSGSSAGI